MTVVVLLCSLPQRSTVTTASVIVSVMSRKLHTIMAFTSHNTQAVACYPYAPVLVLSNSEFVVGAWTYLKWPAKSARSINLQLMFHSY